MIEVYFKTASLIISIIGILVMDIGIPYMVIKEFKQTDKIGKIMLAFISFLTIHLNIFVIYNLLATGGIK